MVLEVVVGREVVVVVIVFSFRGLGGLLWWEIISFVCVKGYSYIDMVVGVDEFYGSNLVGMRFVFLLVGCGLCGYI